MFQIFTSDPALAGGVIGGENGSLS